MTPPRRKRSPSSMAISSVAARSSSTRPARARSGVAVAVATVAVVAAVAATVAVVGDTNPGIRQDEHSGDGNRPRFFAWDWVVLTPGPFRHSGVGRGGSWAG